MEKALFTLLNSDCTDVASTSCQRQALSRAFESSLINAVSDKKAGSSGKRKNNTPSKKREHEDECLRRAVDSFLASPTPSPLELLFVRVATMVHCHTIMKPARPGNSEQLPQSVKETVIALAAALFSSRLHSPWIKSEKLASGKRKSVVCDADSEDKLNHPLWFCFLCIFLQQLSARGGDLSLWQAFLSECSAEASARCSKEKEEADTREDTDNAMPADDSEQLGVSAWGAVSTTLFEATLSRTRYRRSLVVCRSFCPHSVAQAPGTTFRLLDTLHEFVKDWKDQLGGNLQGEEDKGKEKNEAKKKENALIDLYAERLGRILGDANIHALLLATAVGAVLSAMYIFPKRQGQGSVGPADAKMWHPPRCEGALLSESEDHWRTTHFPPIGRLLERLHVKSLIGVHIFAFSVQLCIGLSLSHHTEGREKLALSLYLTEVCSLSVALAIYHYAASGQVPQVQSAKELPGSALKEYTEALHNYVDKAHTVPVFNGTSTLTTRGLSRYSSRWGHGAYNDAVEDEEEVMPMKGEMKGPRFTKMEFPVPCPTWDQCLPEDPRPPAGGDPASSAAKPPSGVVAAAGSKQALTKQHVAPCRFVIELIHLGLPELAADTITRMQREMGIDVCAVPFTAMSVATSTGVATCVMQRFQTTLDTSVSGARDDVTSSSVQRCTLSPSLRVLDEYRPLLEAVHSYVASQTFIVYLVEQLERECKNFLHSTSERQKSVSGACREELQTVARYVLEMAERYLIGVIMPCMCVMSPSRIAYDRIQLLLTLFKEKAPEVYFGTNPVEFLHTDVWLRRLLHDAADPQAPYRAPHDKLRSKELESLFAQSLKRLTSRNVCRYRCLLRPAIYANPLFVAEKMFQQSVGYNNNFLLIHTQLLSGAPPAIMTLIAHVGLHHMRHYANTERFGTADGCRVACIASFLAVLWRDNPRSFDGELLLRAAEYALRRESRAAVVMGLETLRAVLHELMDTKLEHEEKFSAQQLKALMAPSRTQWFAKGAAESFRRVRWDSLFTPAVLATSAAQLQSVLQQPCEVAVEQEDEEGEEEGEGGYKAATETSSAAASCDGIKKEDDEGNEEMILREATAGHLREKGLAPPVMELTLGQAILLHLCRLHSRIYDIQADIAAPMQLLLLTCARDYNVINDLLLCVEKLLLQGPPVEEICMVAMPHIALHLAARFAAKKKITDMRNQQQIQQTSAEGKTPNTKSGDSYQHAGVVDAAFILTPSEVMECFEDTPLWKSICGSISVSLIQQLSCHTGAHFVFDESVYAAAGKELNHYFSSEMSKMKAKAGKSSEAINASMQKNPSFRWMQGQTRYMWREKDAHRKLHQKCAATLSSLLNDMRSGGVFNKPVEFATTYLLPRALISLEDTLFVSHFLRWMLDNTEGEERQCVVDIILSLVTSAATFFVGLTDGECMRIGCLFSFLLTLEKDFAMETLGGTAVVDSAGATAKDSQETTSTPTYQPPSITSEALRTHLDPAPRPLLAILTALSKDEEEGKNEEEKEKAGKDENHERNGTSQSDYTKVPAYPLQLEAFLCRTFVQVLVHQWDVQFLHRNALLVLERLTKNMSLFPSTLCTTEWLISAVSPHAVKSSSSYASATAVLKTLNENYRRCQELVKQPEQSCVAENKKVKAWLKFLKDREVYVYSLLSVDMAASEKKLHEKKAATSHNFAPQSDERDDTDEENEDEGAASRPSQSEGEEANEDLHGSEGTTDDDGKSDDMSDARSSSAGDNRDGSRNDGGSDSGNEEHGHGTQGEGAEEEMGNEEASQKLAENDPRISSDSSGHRTPSSIGGSEKKSRKRGREEVGDESS